MIITIRLLELKVCIYVTVVHTHLISVYFTKLKYMIFGGFFILCLPTVLYRPLAQSIRSTCIHTVPYLGMVMVSTQHHKCSQINSYAQVGAHESVRIIPANNSMMMN